MRTQSPKSPLQLLVIAAALLGFGLPASARPVPARPAPLATAPAPTAPTAPTGVVSLDRLPVGPLTGALEVDNDRRGPVTVFVDGREIGQVPPRSTKVFRGLANGVRLVSYGRRSRVHTERVTVPVRGRAALRVAPTRGVAVITNRSEVPLRLTLRRRDLPHRAGARAPRDHATELGLVELGLLRPGARVETRPLRPGAFVLTAQPVGRFAAGPPITRALDIAAGEQRRVRLGAYLASVTVTNPLRRRARLFIDGLEVGRVRAGERLVAADQLPGDHRLELRGHRRVLVEARVSLRPGERRQWRPQPLAQRGELRIHNDTRVILDVRVDGAPIGRLAPGERTTVAALPVGPVTVAATAPGGRRVSETVTVDPYRVSRISLRLPSASAGWGNHALTVSLGSW